MLSPAQCTQGFPFNVLNAQATAEATIPGASPETKQDRLKMLVKGTSETHVATLFGTSHSTVGSCCVYLNLILIRYSYLLCFRKH